MTFEFIISCRAIPLMDLRQVVASLLAGVLENNQNEFGVDIVDRMIQIRHRRSGEESTGGNGTETSHLLVGFVLELPEETTSAETVVREFADALSDTPPIIHAVKFEDPLLQAELAERAKEIFALEMKLRRVLSIIYLHAYQSEEPFNLLRDETVKPRVKPTENDMKVGRENQFFHLTFGNYAELNQRQKFKLDDLLTVIRNADTYEKFYEEFNRVPIEHKDDAELLAGLKNLMDSIEKMRNCVAHNRRPSISLTENYDNTHPQLHKILDDYLSKWELYLEEMPWEIDAREAVSGALEGAEWDSNNKTIIFYDPDDDRMATPVTSLEELREYLESVAVSAFIRGAPFEGGESVFDCDGYGIVDSILWDYEDRLAELFEGDDTDEPS